MELLNIMQFTSTRMAAKIRSQLPSVFAPKLRRIILCMDGYFHTKASPIYTPRNDSPFHRNIQTVAPTFLGNPSQSIREEDKSPDAPDPAADCAPHAPCEALRDSLDRASP